MEEGTTNARQNTERIADGIVDRLCLTLVPVKQLQMKRLRQSSARWDWAASVLYAYWHRMRWPVRRNTLQVTYFWETCFGIRCIRNHGRRIVWYKRRTLLKSFSKDTEVFEEGKVSQEDSYQWQQMQRRDTTRSPGA